jgi:hypothetical protein
VIAAVMPKATGRAVCLALVAALREYGIPDELLTDIGEQFTARFNAVGVETIFDRICWRTHHSSAHQASVSDHDRKGGAIPAESAPGTAGRAAAIRVGG